MDLSETQFLCQPLSGSTNSYLMGLLEGLYETVCVNISYGSYSMIAFNTCWLLFPVRLALCLREETGANRLPTALLEKTHDLKLKAV